VGLEVAARDRAFFPARRVEDREVCLVPIFVVDVRQTPGAPEGDGWGLTYVYDEDRDQTHLAILDTARWEEGPIARCYFEAHVPMTFHGTWMPLRK